MSEFLRRVGLDFDFHTDQLVMAPAFKSERKRVLRKAVARSASGMAVWEKAARWLEKEMEAGRLAEGARLPTEAELMGKLSLNRHGVRCVIAHLVGKGLVRSTSRLGCFVAPRRLTFEIGSGAVLDKVLAAAGLERGDRVLSYRTCLPPDAVAQWLGVARRTEVLEIVHLSTVNAFPFSQVTTWLPADRFGRLADVVESVGAPGRAISHLGLPGLKRTSVKVLSRRASRSEAGLLGLAASAQVLVVGCLNVDQNGEPTAVTQCIVDAGRVEVAVTL